IIIIDRDYNIVNANLKAKEKFGRALINKKCFDVTHRGMKPCWMEGEECPLSAVFSKGEVLHAIHEHYDLKDNKCYEEIYASPIRDREGNVIYILELMRDVTQRVMNETQLKKRNQELTLLNSLASIISRSLKSEEVFSKVLDKLIETFDMDGGGIFILDENKKLLECSFHRGISEQFVREAGTVRLGEDIPGRVALTGEGITTSDVSQDDRVQRTVLKHSGIKGYCCFPIRGKEKVVGVFCLFKFSEHYFTEDEERILNSVGEMAGLALENIRLYEGMREMFKTHQDRRQREKEFLLSFTSKLASVEDSNALIKEGADLIYSFTRADAIMFWERVDDETLSIRYSKGIFPGVSNLSFHVTCPEVYAIEMKKPIHIYDITEYERLYFIDALKMEGFRSLLSLPVMVGDRAVGVITIANRLHIKYDEDELHFLRIVADIFGMASERSYLYENRIREKGLAEAILNTISEGVCTVSTTGRVISVNRSVERLLGQNAPSLVGQHYQDVFSRFSEGQCPVTSALKGKEAEGEIRVFREGQTHTIKIQSLPLIDPSGRIYGAVQVLRDVTREKEIERMRTDLIRSVSHEFRTPLSAIVGLTEMLIDKEVEGERAEQYLQTIYDEGLRLSEMVSDLLNISKIESGKEQLIYTEVDFDDLIGKVKELFQVPLRKKDIEFKVDYRGKIKDFWADSDRLLQVIANLVDNSIKYSDRGAKIELRIRPHEGYVIIEVADTGWGIPETDIPHIGESFYRGRYATRTKGTGLGLSLCRKIIQLHGGTVNIKSKVGKGTTVTVLLPKERHNGKGNGDR
ncbi:MAG: GAF domain-containing protein, partial [Nitrospirae bacterium]